MVNIYGDLGPQDSSQIADSDLMGSRRLIVDLQIQRATAECVDPRQIEAELQVTSGFLFRDT